jgi:hypothetical protein
LRSWPGGKVAPGSGRRSGETRYRFGARGGDGEEAFRGRFALIGVGSFEVAVGLLVAAPILYLALRDRVSFLVLVLLVVVLSPILGIFIAAILAYVSYALFGGLTGDPGERERSVALLSGQDCATGALYASGVRVLGVVFEVEHYHFLRNLVQDVYGRLATRFAETFLAAQLLREPAQAR